MHDLRKPERDTPSPHPGLPEAPQRGDALRDDEDIFASGYVSSLHALELLQFVERRFDIEVEDSDLELDHFRSVEALERFVNSKKNACRQVVDL